MGTGTVRPSRLDDVAEALHLSKSTVSRAISGKGRIGEQTRREVLSYVQQHGYRPNAIARSLANAKTFNIGAVLPMDALESKVPFFQNVLVGMCKAAHTFDYDVVVTASAMDDIAYVERMTVNRKVDCIVLTRAVTDDPCVAYLLEQDAPFVLIGSSEDARIRTVDTDHVGMGAALTRRMLARGYRYPAYFGGNDAYPVNRGRLAGFRMGAANAEKTAAYVNLTDEEAVARAVMAALSEGADCFVTGDDLLCATALRQLMVTGAPFFGERVASMYDSTLLDAYRPRVMAASVDAKALGYAAVELLLGKDGNAGMRTVLPYTIRE